MFNKKVVFVIGAGASCEIGFPSSKDLTTTISKLLDIKFDDFGSRKETGDDKIYWALNSIVQGTQPKDSINPYLHACWQIRDAMPQALSIDNFLDAHSGNEKIEICGKLAIVRSILEAEKKCDLNFDQRNIYTKLDFSKIEKTWLIPLQQLLFENVHLSNVEDIFSNIAFIVFNYDRCIEHFLFLALKNYYGLDDQVASKILEKLTIFHPYGKVGKLPWQEKKGSINFGTDIHHSNLLELSKQIKTFSERIDDKEALESIKMTLFAANYIFFLGFAYHKQNLDLISSERVGGTKRVIGTGFDISKNDCQIISRSLGGLTESFKDFGNIEIHSGLSCREFFRENWRLLSII